MKKKSILLHLEKPMQRVGSILSIHPDRISAIQRLETGACIVYDVAGNTWRFDGYDEIVGAWEKALSATVLTR